MNLPLLTSRSRVMLFAPHPDDESLATGVFLQRAVAAGAAVRVVYATDGERNGWPQRVLEGKVRIGESDRRRWGARRQAEALAALQTLGVARECVEFLSLPDQGVTDLLLAGCDETVRRLADVIRFWEPTHLLIPSAADTHPDHSGLAVLLGVAIDDHLPPQHEMTQLHYLVHGASQSFAREAHELFSSPLEKKLKRRAIVSHVTQVALSRRRFLAYAKRPERFMIGGREAMRACDGPIHSFLRERNELHLHVAFTLKPLRAEGASLYLLGHDGNGDLRRLRTTLPGRSVKIDLIDCATGAIACIGRYQGDAFSGEILLPLHGFVTSRAIFVKLDRRVWFFDEAGWIEIAAPVAQVTAFRPPLARRELAVA
ncbi:MAG: PIG-L family deacetylase [Chthoniobacterales bacterium]|nr:PIG-L family deacetylase [Chthoniobacterales bacterium]